MKSLNTSVAIREQHDKIYKFNQYVNSQNQPNLKRNPLNMDLTGFYPWFKIWLSAIHKIDDHNLYMANIEKNSNPKRLYF